MPPTGDSVSTRYPRRPVLKGLGALGSVALAGCVSTDDGIDVEGDAEELILEGFREEGVEPPVETTIYANSESKERVQWAELVHRKLDGSDLFDVSFETREWNTYVEMVTNMADDETNALICMGFIGGWDPHEYVYPGFHSDSFPPHGLNVVEYENERVDELIDEGVETVDDDERVEIYEELQRLLVEESPLSFVCTKNEVVTYRADAIDGFRTYPVAGGEYKSLYAPTLGVYTEVGTDGDELVADVPTEIGALDPVAAEDDSSYMVTELVYEQLLEVDFDGTVRPLLATDWYRVDETTWRFELREDVRFHTGAPFTAADVEATFERYEGTPNERSVYDWYDGVEILGDREFELSLTRPYGPLETAIAQIPIVPRAAAAGDLDLSKRPVGTGPYAFEEHEEGMYWRLTANWDHWHDGGNDVPETPPIETVTLRIIPDPSVRRSALEAGDIHLSTDVPKASLEAFETDDAFVVDRTTGTGVEFLGYPIYLEPFTNPKVRRGIGRLVPRERIVRNVFRGVGAPAYTPISPIHEEYVDPAFEDEIVDEYFG